MARHAVVVRCMMLLVARVAADGRLLVDRCRMTRSALLGAMHLVTEGELPRWCGTPCDAHGLRYRCSACQIRGCVAAGTGLRNFTGVVTLPALREGSERNVAMCRCAVVTRDALYVRMLRVLERGRGRAGAGQPCRNRMRDGCMTLCTLGLRVEHMRLMAGSTLRELIHRQAAVERRDRVDTRVTTHRAARFHRLCRRRLAVRIMTCATRAAVRIVGGEVGHEIAHRVTAQALLPLRPQCNRQGIGSRRARERPVELMARCTVDRELPHLPERDLRLLVTAALPAGSVRGAELVHGAGVTLHALQSL